MYTVASLPQILKSRFFARGVLPVLLVGVALLLTRQVPDVQEHSFFSLFLAGVATAAYLGGWQAGVFATVLSMLASDLVFLRPTGSFLIDSREDLVRLLAFLFTAAVICALAWLVQRKETALRGAELSLDEQRQEIEFLKSTGRIWSWEYDLATGRVTWTNLFSPVVMRREEPLASWLESIHPGDREQVKAALDHALNEGEFEAQYRVVLNDGNARLVLGRAVLFSVGGKIAGLRGIEMDLARRTGAGWS